MGISNILIAILLFSAIILFHELGHFLVAKANKVGVIEFSLGMGPRIISFAKTDKGNRVKFFGNTARFFGVSGRFNQRWLAFFSNLFYDII